MDDQESDWVYANLGFILTLGVGLWLMKSR